MFTVILVLIIGNGQISHIPMETKDQCKAALNQIIQKREKFAKDSFCVWDYLNTEPTIYEVK